MRQLKWALISADSALTAFNQLQSSASIFTAVYVDLLSDLHIRGELKFKYQNAHNSKYQIALDLKFSINAGKFKSDTTNGKIKDAMP